PEAVFHFISGSGTKAKSSFMWARVKAETEEALRGVGLGGVVCWRPGYIHPQELPAGRQLGERAVHAIYPVLKPFSGLSIEDADLGRARLQAALDGRHDGVMKNKEIRELAKQYAVA